MEGIVSWVKNYSLVFLFFTVLTSLASKKEYRRYLELFAELVLVITLLMPLLKLLGRESDFLDKIAYDTFWQGLDGIKADREKLDFLGEETYIAHYEKVIEADVSGMAEDAGYGVLRVKASLNRDFTVERLEMDLAKKQDYTVIQGSIEAKPEEREITILKEKISEFYQIEVENIVIQT